MLPSLALLSLPWMPFALAAPVSEPASPDEAPPHGAPQSFRTFPWTVTVDPLTTVLGFVHVQVERTLGEHLSLYAGPSLKLFNSPLGIATGAFKGYGVEAGLRAFVWGRAPRGAWVMARGVFADVVYDSTVGADPAVILPNPASMPGGYASLLAGYTGIVGPGLTLSGGLGVSYFDYGPAYGIHGFLPAAHTNIGWAF